jgi:hypothetical protein
MEGLVFIEVAVVAVVAMGAMVAIFNMVQTNDQ